MLLNPEFDRTVRRSERLQRVVPCQVLIFPGVRIERPADMPETAEPADGGGAPAGTRRRKARRTS